MLQQILEKAVETNADAIELEYEDEGLGICYFYGNTGVGELVVDDQEQQMLIDEIVEKAKLQNRVRAHSKPKCPAVGGKSKSNRARASVKPLSD